MSSPWYIDQPDAPSNRSLTYAHGTVMIVAWILFASIGILFARYGRTLRIGGRQKFLGETIWFHIHRLLLCLTVITTLLGFLLILAKAKGTWVDIAKDGGRIFVHSILGGIIVCCSLMQAWIALFRCHPNGKFRYIFNWIHRTTGYLSFLLSIPTIFLVVVEPRVYPMEQDGLIAILSLWSAWVIIIVILFEIIEYRSRIELSQEKNFKNVTTLDESSTSLKKTTRKHERITHNRSINNIKLILFIVHIIITISLLIPLIVLTWKQT